VSATLYRWFQKSPERRAARGLDPYAPGDGFKEEEED